MLETEAQKMNGGDSGSGGLGGLSHDQKVDGANPAPSQSAVVSLGKALILDCSQWHQPPMVYGCVRE